MSFWSINTLHLDSYNLLLKIFKENYSVFYEQYIKSISLFLLILGVLIASCLLPSCKTTLAKGRGHYHCMCGDILARKEVLLHHLQWCVVHRSQYPANNGCTETTTEGVPSSGKKVNVHMSVMSCQSVNALSGIKHCMSCDFDIAKCCSGNIPKLIQQVQLGESGILGALSPGLIYPYKGCYLLGKIIPVMSWSSV